MRRKLRRILFIVLALGMCHAARGQRPELVIQTGHADRVSTVAFSPDGRMLASGSDDNTIKLWDVATGQELRTLTGHARQVSSVAFSSDGRTLASGSADKTIKLWDAATGQELRTLAGHADEVDSVAFSPDGRTLASGSADKTIKLWDVASGHELRTLAGHTGLIFLVAFSPDGRTLASGSADKTIKLWDAATGQELLTLAGHTDLVTCVSFSPDGRTLASGGVDQSIRLWDIATGRALRTLTGHTETVNSIAFSPDGRTLASGSGDKTAKLWDPATGQELRTLAGHTDEVESVAFSPDGRSLASGSRDKTIKLWDVATGKELRTLAGHTDEVESVAFSPDGRTLATGSAAALKLLDLTTGRQLRALAGGESPVAFSPDGRTVASGGDARTIKLWDIATGRELLTLAGNGRQVHSVAFSPDGQTLASESEDDNEITLWDVATGHKTRTVEGGNNRLESLAFSPDGRTLAAGTGHYTVILWDFATGQELRTLEGHTDAVFAVAFSPDGRTHASAGADNSIKLWDVATGQELRTLEGHTDAVFAVAFSPDGRTLASAGADNSIKLWDVATGRELRALAGHTGVVSSIVFSPDGHTLTSGGADGSARVWNLADGSEIATVVALDESDWAAVTPAGVFDASPGGMALMHWAVGAEMIALDQLKDRFWDPGLLAKIFGFNKEPIRDVTAFETVKLFPEVQFQAPPPGSMQLKLALKNRGGGIGPVQVLVNGKEVVADARGGAVNPGASDANLTVDLSASHYVPGQANEIRVVTRNAEGYLTSRGEPQSWTPEGQPDNTPPEFWAIVAGISVYASPDVQLRYAAKDAVDISHAIQPAAEKLFGASHVHVTLLTTAASPGAIAPTKANLQRAFAQIAAQAKPRDVLLVYLAGHGIALHGQTDLYAYLTADARSSSTDELSDPALRAQWSITSDELSDWTNRIPALKQVLILDTCAAGAAGTKLIEKRDIPADQVRALDRLKDRTGFHVLMGAAADQSSYEASEFEQGLLTYSLLEGMRDGAALREGEFLDVSLWFQHAADEVPELAQDVGGIQRPVVAAPSGTSFDVGEVDDAIKLAIHLAAAKPFLLRPQLLDPEQEDDELSLSATLAKRLNDESFIATRGAEAPLRAVYLDAGDLPGAIRILGTYQVTGPAVSVTIDLRRDKDKLDELHIQGTRDDVSGLVEQMVEAIEASIAQVRPKN